MSIITIRFQRKNISETVSNYVLVGSGCLSLYFGIPNYPMLAVLGGVFLIWGIFLLSKSKGVLVESGTKNVWCYRSYLWIKIRNRISLNDIGSVMVTTGTQVHGGSNGISVSSSISFMVYKLFLLPSPYSKIEKIHLDDFFTKEECMKAAEELSKTAELPLVLKIR